VPVYSTVNSQLTLQESEFEAYEIYYAPVTLGIHLKELNVRHTFPCLTTYSSLIPILRRLCLQATLAVAEALGSDIVLRFTASGQPIFFSLESSIGTYNAFCALSTKAVKEAREDGKQPVWGGAGNGTGDGEINSGNEAVQRKRQREFEGFDGARHPSKRKATLGTAGAAADSTSNGMRTPVGFAPSTSTGSRPRTGSHVYVESDPGFEGGSGADNDNDNGLSFAGVATSTQPRGDRHRPEYTEDEPLFLPEPSQSIDGKDGQMEPPASQVLRDAGLQDFERMSQMELRAMLEDDDEEMDEITGGFDDAARAGDDVEMGEVEKVRGERGGTHYAPTQPSREDEFRPLFDD
jgi:Rad9